MTDRGKRSQKFTNPYLRLENYRTLKYGVPQGSILGPLLFNLFMNDIFYFIDKSKLANYADDTSTYLSDEGIFPFLHALKSETEVVLEWFRINEMKSNSDKCHLIVAENEHRPSYISNSYIYILMEKGNCFRARALLNF